MMGDGRVLNLGILLCPYRCKRPALLVHQYVARFLQLSSDVYCHLHPCSAVPRTEVTGVWVMVVAVANSVSLEAVANNANLEDAAHHLLAVLLRVVHHLAVPVHVDPLPSKFSPYHRVKAAVLHQRVEAAGAS